MRKLPLFSAMLILFLLVPASITWAQMVSVTGNVYEKNTVKNTFKTPHGNITTILPDDMAAGDVISGSVIYQPEGRSEREKNKNREQLLGYKLFLDNETPLKAETEHDKHVFVTELTIPPLKAETEHDKHVFVNNLRLTVRDPQNKIVGESRLPLMDKSILMSPVFLDYGDIKSKATTPIIQTDKKIYLSGENAAISLPPVLGKVILEDHIISFVQFSMAGQKPEPARIELQPLVSSPRRMVVQIPANLYGPGEIILEDKSKKIIASQKIHVLQLEASCPKTSLLKNEKTVLKVTVNGLKDCPADYIRLNLDNITSTSVQLGQSNHEELVVKLVTKTDTRLNEDSVADIITKINWDNKPQDENIKLASKNRNVEDAEQYENDELSLQRSVTALQSGSFTINIRLSYPSSVYNDPFRQQLDALKTVEQFNNWQDALKADSSGEHIPDGMIEICRRLSSITSPAELDEAKARAYNFISWPRIGQEVIVDYFDCTLEAGKAAVQNAISNAGTEPVNIEMIQTALRSAGKKADIAGNTALKDAAGSLLKEDVLKLQQAINSESEKVQILNNIRKVLNDASKATVRNTNRPDPVKDLIGYLDPYKKTLFVIPEYQAKVLDMLGAKTLPNGEYQINSMTANRKPITYNITIFASTPGLLFDPEKGVTEAPAQEESKYKNADATFKDSNGTECKFYKDAICGDALARPWKSNTCSPHSKFEYDPKTKEGKLVPDGKYYKFEGLGRRLCEKGNSFCVEMYLVVGLEHIYEDKNCTRLLDVEKIYNFTCQ